MDETTNLITDRVALATARASIGKVKGALDRDAAGALSHYLIKGGAILATASLGGVLASAPFPWSGEALANGGALEDVLDRMPSDPLISQEDDRLTLRAGRARGEVRTLPISAAWSARPPEEAGALPVSDELWRAVEALEPFIADEGQSPWMSCLIVKRGQLVAVGTSAAVIAVAEGPDFGCEALIPKRGVTAAVKVGKPARIAVSAEAAAFWWPDGAWMRVQTVVGNVPGTVSSLAAKAEAAAGAPPIAPEWRAAVERVAGFAESRLRLEAGRAVAQRGVGQVEDEATSPVPEGREWTEWPAKMVLAVLECADRWDVTAHPAPFAGPVVRGLICGYR